MGPITSVPEVITGVGAFDDIFLGSGAGPGTDMIAVLLWSPLWLALCWLADNCLGFTPLFARFKHYGLWPSWSDSAQVMGWWLGSECWGASGAVFQCWGLCSQRLPPSRVLWPVSPGHLPAAGIKADFSALWRGWKGLKTGEGVAWIGQMDCWGQVTLVQELGEGAVSPWRSQGALRGRGGTSPGLWVVGGPAGTSGDLRTLVGLHMREEVLLPSVLHVLWASFLVSVGIAVVLSHFTRVRLCDPMDCHLHVPLFMGFSKTTGVGRSLGQGIFLTQGLNPGLLLCRRTLYHLNHQGSPRVGITPTFLFKEKESWNL